MTTAVLSDSDDNCGSTNDCVIGLSLIAWAGLNSNEPSCKSAIIRIQSFSNVIF